MWERRTTDERSGDAMEARRLGGDRAHRRPDPARRCRPGVRAEGDGASGRGDPRNAGPVRRDDGRGRYGPDDPPGAGEGLRQAAPRDDAAELLAAAPLHAIAYGFTSSAYVIGMEGEAEMIARLERRTRGIPVVVTCGAAVEGLRVLGARRMALIDPPWFDTELNGLGRRYYESAGFEVVYSSPCGLPSDQTKITRPQSCTRGSANECRLPMPRRSSSAGTDSAR